MVYKIPKKKSRIKKDSFELVAKRVDNAQNFVGSNIYPANFKLGLKEGKDYEVLAYTDWADTFVPTIVRWRTGEVDDFSDEKRTRKIISNLK